VMPSPVAPENADMSWLWAFAIARLKAKQEERKFYVYARRRKPCRGIDCKDDGSGWVYYYTRHKKGMR
jgi:hypothetical protein